MSLAHLFVGRTQVVIELKVTRFLPGVHEVIIFFLVSYNQFGVVFDFVPNWLAWSDQPILKSATINLIYVLMIVIFEE